MPDSIGGASFDIVANFSQAIAGINQVHQALAGLATAISSADAPIRQFDQTFQKLQSGLVVPQQIAAEFQKVGESGQTAAKGVSQISQETEKAASSAKSAQSNFTGFGNAFKAINQEVSGITQAFGLSGAAAGLFGVALGAIATGALFAVIGQVRQLGTALIEVFTKDIPAAIAAADALDVMEKRIEAIFGNASKAVLDFANTTALNLGFTQKEAAGAAAAFGNAFQQIGLSSKDAAGLSVGLTQAAAAIRFTAEGTVSLAQVTKDVNLALEGNVRVLRQYDIVTSIAAQKAALLADAGITIKGGLDEETSAFATLLLIYDAAIQRQSQLTAQNQSLNQEFTVLKASLTDIGTAFGAVLLPAVKVVVGIFSDLFFIIAKGVTSLEALIKSSAIAKGFLEALGLTIGGPLLSSLVAVEGALHFVARALGLDKDETAKLTAEKQKAIDKELEHRRALAGTGEELQKNIDALNAVSEAERKGLEDIAAARNRINRAVFDAETRLGDVQIQNARRIADAILNATRAEEDFVKVQVDAARKIADANQRVSDAIDKAADDNKKAQQKIDDENRRHTRSVEDLSDRIKKAKEQEAKSFLDAELAIEAALLKGNEAAFNAAEVRLAEARRSGSANGELATAQRDLAREQQDHARNLKRLTDDAAETQLRDQKAIAKAVQDRARAEQDADFAIRRAQEQVNKAVEDERRAYEDSARALAKVLVENNRAVVDAQRALADTTRAANAAVRTAQEAVGKIAASLGLSVDAFRTLIEEAIVFAEIIHNTFPNEGAGFGGFGATGSGRAAGGPVFAGQLTPVGERGPELFIPPVNGTIVSNDDLRKFFQKSGSGDTSITINEVASDPRATAFAISQELARNVG